MERTKWLNRKFDLQTSPGLLPNILERLRGTSMRLRYMYKDLSDGDLEFKPNGAWSIKEHIGHLSELEDVHEGRLQDFLNRKETLRAADMNNTATNNAGHNQFSLEHIMKVFDTKRFAFIEHLQKLDDATQNFSSLHPRLKQNMRPVDMAFFTAEHDDQHLAIIREIIIKLGK